MYTQTHASFIYHRSIVGDSRERQAEYRVSYRCELVDGRKVHLNFRVHFIQGLQPASRCHQGHHLVCGGDGWKSGRNGAEVRLLMHMQRLVVNHAAE